jgi:hypothetical protein
MMTGGERRRNGNGDSTPLPPSNHHSKKLCTSFVVDHSTSVMVIFVFTCGEILGLG